MNPMIKNAIRYVNPLVHKRLQLFWVRCLRFWRLLIRQVEQLHKTVRLVRLQVNYQDIKDVCVINLIIDEREHLMASVESG